MPEQQQPPAGHTLDLTAGAVARRLGVAVTTLRSWDRRYGMGASHVSAGGHRRYSPSDVHRLERTCALVADGVPMAQAAQAVLDDSLCGVPGGRPRNAAADSRLRDRPGEDGGTGGRSGGGHTLPTGAHVGRRARGLARAAIRLDSAAVQDVLDRAIAELGVASAWEDLIRPVLYGMGRKWESGADDASSTKYVEVEHLLSECVLAALHRAAQGSDPDGSSPLSAPCAFGTRGVLLSCTASELHTLPLHALNAALAERRITTRMFGAALPAEALHRAAERTRPSAVVLWSQHPDTADPDALDLLRDIPGTAVLTAGAGWRTPSARDTARLTGLTQALAVLAPAPPLNAPPGIPALQRQPPQGAPPPTA